MPLPEIWIDIVRHLNYQDAVALAESDPFFKTVITDFEALNEKILYFRVMHLNKYERNIQLLHMGKEVGRLYYDWDEWWWGYDRLSKALRELKPIFQNIKGRIKKIVIEADKDEEELIIPVDELLKALVELDIEKIVEEVEFAASTFIHFNRYHHCEEIFWYMTPYTFPVKAVRGGFPDLINEKVELVSLINFMLDTDCAFCHCFYSGKIAPKRDIEVIVFPREPIFDHFRSMNQ